MNEAEALDLRVLVWAVGRDGPLTGRVLSDAGVACRNCTTLEEFCAELARGAGAAVVAGELLTGDAADRLRALLGRQPPWSDLPLVVVGSPDAAEVWENPLAILGNVSVLVRPLPPSSLIATVGMALRGRRRQYEVRELLRQRDEADKRKDEFLAMLAHELRNPLAPIRSAAEVLRVQCSQDPALTRVHDIIARQVGHMARLVDDLLDVSRLTRGKITLKREVLELGEALAAVVRGMAPVAEGRGVELSLQPLGEPILVEADPTRLEQMVGNALSNALKFTPAGGRVTVSAAREGSAAVIRVADTGVGLGPDQLQQVFELFAQTDRSLDRSQGGLGIGLTILRGLAELHGGSAELRSDGEGKGAEAVIRLPALTPARPGLPPPDRDGAAEVEARRVLVIDDNADAADSLALFLSAHGHDVACVYDPHAALESARGRPPEVAVCDIGLPRMDGYELVGRLRRELGLSACVCVAVTGYGEEKDRRRALEAGFDHHMTKPVDPNDLLRLISQSNGRGR